MARLRAISFVVCFYGWTVALCPFYVPLMLLPRPWFRVMTRFWTRGAVLFSRVCLGIDYEVSGREHIPDGPFIVAAKHQSMWETLIFNMLFPDCAFILKRSLFAVPLVGWFMWRAGMVAVDRTAGASALRKMVREARRVMAEGRPLIIFPEGTRVAPKTRRPYQPGVAALHRELDMPVLPVALNSGSFWPRRTFVKRPGTISVAILPAIEPGLDRRDFMARLERDIESEMARLEQETPCG
jgi:1-acyl-sn-glycerol-3-phosphate acyltransferase